VERLLRAVCRILFRRTVTGQRALIACSTFLAILVLGRVGQMESVSVFQHRYRSTAGSSRRPATFIRDLMLAGSIVMLIGCLFLLGYKQIALGARLVSRVAHSTAPTAGTEQMLTILGSLLLVFGFGCFLFF
jgi:hypothetical protein